MNEDRVSSFLAHYASKYYDPVKAKEYYERTKELKGREPAVSAESRQRQSQATAYVRNEISTRKKADLEANAATQDKLRNSATAKAEAHKARMEKLQADAEATRDAIVNKLKAEVEKIQGELKIPTNASPKLRAFLEKQQATRARSASSRAQGDLQKLRSNVSAVVENARKEYQAFRESNTTARRATSEARKKLTEQYRNDLLREQQNIKDQVR